MFVSCTPIVARAVATPTLIPVGRFWIALYALPSNATTLSTSISFLYNVVLDRALGPLVLVSDDLVKPIMLAVRNTWNPAIAPLAKCILTLFSLARLIIFL